MKTNSTVIVVGAGLAGLTSAIEAYRHSAHVIVLEKMGSVGGNSAKATSGINGAETRYQAQHGVHDTLAGFQADTMHSGDDLAEPHLVQTLVAQSAQAVEWLSSFGVDLSSLVQCGGHSVPRTHREPPRADGKPAPVGWDIIAALKRYVDETKTKAMASATSAGGPLACGSIDVVTNATVVGLLQDAQGKGVTGVQYLLDGNKTPIDLVGDAVILSTGGFAYDTHTHSTHSFVRQYAPRFQNLPTTNGSFAVGDGVRLAMAVGADLVDMDKIQVHPTSFVDPAAPKNGVKFLAPEALRGCGAVLLNDQGVRFADELGRRDYLSKAIFEQHPVAAAADAAGILESVNVNMVLNDRAVDLFGRAAFDFYANQKLFFVTVDGFAGLASHLGVPLDTIKRTFEAYNAAATGLMPDVYGKRVFPVHFQETQKLYVGVVTPAIHYCMGGTRFNAAGEILSADKPTDALMPRHVGRRYQIMGLYGVGEVTGGLHGGNRLAGNSLLECVVFGRLAGRRAAKTHLATSQPALTKDAWTPLFLRQKQLVSGCTWIFSFDLPSPKQYAGLDMGEYVSVRATLKGEETVRYYSPISRGNDPGVLELLIKCEDNGTMSSFLGSLKPGDTLDFKGPLGGLTVDFTKKKRVAMLAGGVGISPMIQILRSAFYAHQDVELTLLYGAVEEKELVFMDLLLEKQREFPNFKLHLLLNKPPANWTGSTGFINEDMIKRTCPPAGEDVKIVLCGPGPMCKALKPVLEKLYPPENVYSFM